MTSASRVTLTSQTNGTILQGGTSLPAVNATAMVYRHGTTTAANVYAAETGSTQLSQPLTADSNGQLPGWVEHGQDLDIVATYGGFTASAALVEPARASLVVSAISGVYNLGTDAWENMAIGVTLSAIQAGLQPTLASYNTAVGSQAMQNVTTGNFLSAFGRNALKSNTIGVANTAIGTEALQSCTTGGNNTAVGGPALTNLTSAGGCTAVGVFCLDGITTGGFHTGVGGNALLNATTGINNTAVGYNAGLNVSTGSHNTAVGFGSGTIVTSGNYNTHVGYQAGTTGTGANWNTTCIGRGTNASGQGGVAIGCDSAGNGATAAGNVIALGVAAHQVQVLNNTTGAGSAALGANCPAVTATAPYTWFKMMSGDGSTVFVPAWK